MRKRFPLRKYSSPYPPQTEEKMMMKNFIKYVSLVLCVCALYLTGVDASFADAKYSAAELKKMSTFLSNFTEVGMRDFDVSTITRDALIHFGVQHNNINNFKSRVVQCKINGCPHGSLAIDAKYVDETIKKYFAKNFKDHGSVKPDYDYDKEYLYYFDKILNNISSKIFQN